MAKNTEAPARRGRKPSFPDQETVPLLSWVPEEIRTGLREIADARYEGRMNVALATLVEQALSRSRAARKSRRKAQAES
jgi:hypothetical protein